MAHVIDFNDIIRQRIYLQNLQNFGKQTIVRMQRIKFKISPCTINPYQWLFVPSKKETSPLESNPDCEFKVIWWYIIDPIYRIFRILIQVNQLKINNQQLKIYQYLQMLFRWVGHINRQNRFQVSVSLDIQNQSYYCIRIMFISNFFELINNIHFAQNKWKQVKQMVIQPIFANIHYQDKLTFRNLERLKFFHQKYQSMKDFQRKRRLGNSQIQNNQNIKPDKLIQKYNTILTTIQFIQGFKKQSIQNKNENNTNQLFKQQDKQQNKVDFINKMVTKVLLAEENVEQCKKQVNHSIYHNVLDVRPFTFNQSLKKKKKYENNAICQGIQIIKQIQQYRHRITFLSQIMLKRMRFIYKFSVHNHYDNMDQFQQMDEMDEMDQNHQQQFDEKDLVVKRCLKSILYRQIQHKNKLLIDQMKKKIQQQGNNQNDLQKLNEIKKIQYQQKKDTQKYKQNQLIYQSQQSFINQFNFLKFIRNKIFPYIARYFIEISSEIKKQKDQDIINKVIYIEPYQNNLYFLLQDTQSFSKLTLQTLIDILFQISATLRFLDRQQILHRDIKPVNIFINQNYNVKFIDWGSCCTRQQYKCPIQINLNYLTKQLHLTDQDQSQHNQIENFNFARGKRFVQAKQKLLTTKNWSQQSKYFQLEEKQIFDKQFENNHARFDTNYYFDVYSFGNIIKRMLEKLDARYTLLNNKQFWLLQRLNYLKQKCLQVNPYDRLCPLQIMLYLSELIKILRQKRKIIKRIQLNKQGIIMNIN